MALGNFMTLKKLIQDNRNSSYPQENENDFEYDSENNAHIEI